MTKSQAQQQIELLLQIAGPEKREAIIVEMSRLRPVLESSDNKDISFAALQLLSMELVADDETEAETEAPTTEG